MQRIAIFLTVVSLASCGLLHNGKIPLLDGRIVGGEEIAIESAPYQVSVRYNDQHMCGGSIISENKVLTAAHCTDGARASQLSVRAGSSGHSSGELIAVSSIAQNADYDSWNIDSDVSVLTLSKSLTFGTKIQPIQLANANPAIGTALLVTGWGVVQESSSSVPSQLREVTVLAISEADCKNAYGSSSITKTMLCAGYVAGGKDSCQGDSGGPLVNPVTGEQVGVVSWGYGCARPNYPGVYASVANLLPAINKLKEN